MASCNCCRVQVSPALLRPACSAILERHRAWVERERERLIQERMQPRKVLWGLLGYRTLSRHEAMQLLTRRSSDPLWGLSVWDGVAHRTRITDLASDLLRACDVANAGGVLVNLSDDEVKVIAEFVR